MNRDKVLELAKEAELARQFALEVPFVVDRLERFAALVEAEVRGDAEPTLYQRRIKPVFDCKFPWSDWKECSKEVFDQFEKQQVWGDYIYEVRRLYLHPAPAVGAEPVVITNLAKDQAAFVDWYNEKPTPQEDDDWVPCKMPPHEIWRAALEWARGKPAEEAQPVFKDIDDSLEKAYWQFDAMVKGYGEWKLRRQSERDAFKQAVRLMGPFTYVAPETLHEAEECECVHLALSKRGVPDKDENGNKYSLLGRVELYASPALSQPANVNTVVVQSRPAPATDAEPALSEWLDKTEWVQKRRDWPFPALGMHRADVMRRYIEHLEAKSGWDAQPVGYTNEGYKGMQYANAEAYKEIRSDFIERNKLTAPLFAHPAPAVVRQLVDAIEPLAHLDLKAGQLEKYDDDLTVYQRDNTKITIGDIRKARLALEAAKGKGL